MTRCPICAHERIAAINDLLREHTAVDAVAIAYGLPEEAVEAHVQHVQRGPQTTRNIRGTAFKFEPWHISHPRQDAA